MRTRITNRVIGSGLGQALLALAMITICAPAGGAGASIIREDNSEIQKQLGVPLYVWRDSSAAKPNAVLLAVHGSAQEGSVMDALARNLVPEGFMVIAPDVRGNGRWQKLQQPNETADIQLMESCQDLSRIIAMVNQTLPNTQIFCLGESIGAGVVMKAVTDNPRNVKGIILISAGVKPHIHNPLNMGGSFFKHMAMLTQPVDLSNYLSRYCSDDPRVITEMLNDPLAKNHQSGLELLGTFAFLHQEPVFAQMMPRQIPVLVIQGTEDQIVDPMSVSLILQALPSIEKRLVMIPGCGHVIVGTSFIKQQVLLCLQDWLLHHESFGSQQDTAEREHSQVDDRANN